jgi:A/G-specific adenine glycosylase
MDLGATICTPRTPNCGACPWRTACRAHAAGTQASFPVKPAKVARPRRQGVAFVLHDHAGAVWLTRRGERGLLAGMMQVPTTEWDAAPPSPRACAAARPQGGIWRRLEAPVRHVFTHFELELAVEVAIARATPPGEGEWWPLHDIAAAGLPSVFRKLVAAAAGDRRSGG